METSKNKIALVTGGSRGLGKDMALRIAERGNDVIITYHSNKDAAEAVISEIESRGQKAIALQLAVEDSASFENFKNDVTDALKKQFDRTSFDYLVNNAGIGMHAPIAETTSAQFDQLFNIHLKGPYFLTQSLLPLIADNGGIINVSTGLARFALPGYSAYASMKGGIEVFTTYLAKELGSRGINANVIAPGAIATDFGGGVVRDNEQVNNFISSNTALGRVGQATDIGGVVAFLCSDDANWVNAQRIEVSGGQSI
ncbi:SDR family NAD(P)-dependent oxidoreductase [Flagellimonas meridianipacifica]|uniref:NAD(P)-dependent dehydrogenase (Short-subunit alcohol dehydrogenase family) n=1 Tax=Flagellimonas meridianipacifica TaxID=1080225 RepID=A0A2T0MJB8_9FLAO|nr:SDR family oxidoreductase [Allomuricauda pacifica]PRX57596.1 NAD(P)-dependent dehydrogenase (short-subunit alcohol dehydrogenase family) [Allomuricauda pacifica]